MLGLNRLDGRFIWLSGILLFCLIVVSLYSHFQVKEISGESVQLIQETRELNTMLVGIKNSLQETESALYQYSALFENSQHDIISQHILDLRERSSALIASPLLKSDRQCLISSRQLIGAIGGLEISVRDYLRVMASVQNRYPGMPILLQYLEPSNRRFSEAVEQALLEGAASELPPGMSEREQHQIQKLFEEIRYAWSQQIGWVRIFVANRMGAFGNPEDAMKQNLANRAIYASTINDLIHRLEKYNRYHKLGLQQSESIGVMRSEYGFYEHYFKMAVETYLSKNWRADSVLLKMQIQPSIIMALKSIKEIEERFKEFSNLSLDKAQSTAQMLSEFFWLFIAASAGLLWVAYIMFNNSIRKPLLQVSKAMEAEGRGEAVVPSVKAQLKEIEFLVQAFSGMREQVHSRQQRLESILQNAAEGILIVSEAGVIELANGAALQLFEYAESEMVGSNISQLISRDDEAAVNFTHNLLAGTHDFLGGELELEGQRKDGSIISISLKISEITAGAKRLYTAIVSDNSERKAVMLHLRHMAEHDALTGLYNRQYFLNALELAVENAQRTKTYSYACLYIDLDNFKYLNDSHGHLQGDRMLVELAEILRKRTRKTDILARLGGDEFVILLANVDLEHATQTAEYYRQKIATYMFHCEGKIIDIGSSIGLAMMSADTANKEQLLMHADIACHVAKSEGRNRVCIYREEDKSKVNSVYSDMGWSQRINTALREDKFILEYQAVSDCITGSRIGYEVLIRLLDEDTNNLILPGAFFGIAERFGLMDEIDRWVVNMVCGKIAALQVTRGDALTFLNLSGGSVGNPQILSLIQACIQDYAIRPGNIVFEFTEQIAISSMESTINFINKVNLLGCLTALDDFGVGYSSFAHLKELPVDFVKIDGSYMQGLGTNPLNQALVKSICEVSHALGKRVIAEAVDDASAHSVLSGLGIDLVQGRYLSHPGSLPGEDIDTAVVGDG